MSDSLEDSTLTLKEAAALLRVSYSTVYAHREELGFFQVGSTWRVWKSRLMAMGTVDSTVSRINAAKPVDKTKLVTQGTAPLHFAEINQRQIEEELDRLLGQPRKPRKPAR